MRHVRISFRGGVVDLRKYRPGALNGWIREVHFWWLAQVALTRGSYGSLLVSAEGKVSDHPWCPLGSPMVDTVGAGDSFTTVLGA